MHPLQDLITDGNEPNGNIEYIVTYDVPQIGQRNPITKGTVVNNVKRRVIDGHNHGYEFTIKETGETSITMYAWALAENTVENLIELETYWAMQEQVKAYQKAVRRQGKRLKTLE